MGSESAILERHGEGSRLRYGNNEHIPVPEGVEGGVPYKGALNEVLALCVGALRKTMEYVGAATIEEFRQKAEFVAHSSAGTRESHPHDLVITRESPNYSL